MTTKFNKDMYAKIKGKKNEPLFNIGQRKLKIMDNEKEKESETAERGSSTLLWMKDGLLFQPFLSRRSSFP